MKKLIKRYVRQQIALSCPYEDTDTLNQCADFVFNAPIWEWKFRLKLVQRGATLPMEQIEMLFRFACQSEITSKADLSSSKDSRVRII